MVKVTNTSGMVLGLGVPAGPGVAVSDEVAPPAAASDAVPVSEAVGFGLAPKLSDALGEVASVVVAELLLPPPTVPLDEGACAVPEADAVPAATPVVEAEPAVATTLPVEDTVALGETVPEALGVAEAVEPDPLDGVAAAVPADGVVLRVPD
jgi:hypothetical protein